MDPSVYIIAYSARLISFVGILCLFPSRFVPFIVRLAFFVNGIIFVMPLHPGLSSLSLAEQLSVLSNFSRLKLAAAACGYETIITEAVIGVLLAVVAGTAGYLARLIASWFLLILSGLSDSHESIQQPSLSSKAAWPGASLEGLFMLLLLGCLFSSPIAPWLFGLTARVAPVLSFPSFADALKSSRGTFMQPIIDTGSAALCLAFIIAIPAFVGSLLADIIALPWQRYFAASFSAEITVAARGLVVISLLSASIYYLADDLSAVLEKSLNQAPADSLQQALEKGNG